MHCSGGIPFLLLRMACRCLLQVAVAQLETGRCVRGVTSLSDACTGAVT